MARGKTPGKKKAGKTAGQKKAEEQKKQQELIKIPEQVYGKNVTERYRKWKEEVDKAYSEYITGLKKSLEEMEKSGFKVDKETAELLERGWSLKERNLTKKPLTLKELGKSVRKKKGAPEAYFVQVDLNTARDLVLKFGGKGNYVELVGPGNEKGLVMLRVKNIETKKAKETGYVQEVLSKIKEGEFEVISHKPGVTVRGKQGFIRAMITKDQLKILQDKYPELRNINLMKYKGKDVVIADIPDVTTASITGEGYADIIINGIASGTIRPLPELKIKEKFKEKAREAEEARGEEAPEPESGGGEPPRPEGGGKGGEGSEKVKKAAGSKGVTIVKEYAPLEIPPIFFKLLFIFIVIGIIYALIKYALGW